MNRARRFLFSSILGCVLLAALVLATTAAAEVRVGEATRPVNPLIDPQADIIGAKAEYDSDTGTVTFNVTTAALPSPGTEEEPSELEMPVALGSVLACDSTAVGGGNAYPAFSFTYQYAQANFVTWAIFESAAAEPKFDQGTAGLATRTASVTTTTFIATAPLAVNRPFNCAIAGIQNNHVMQGPLLIFPIAVPPAPTNTAPTQTQTQTPASTSQAAPAALSIAGSKPLKLKTGKWATVRIKLTNPGGSATTPGSIRLTAPTGVLVKPEKQRLPVLPAGGAWTIPAKVQLTAQAKKKSTVAVTATAGHLTAKGALVLKRQG